MPTDMEQYYAVVFSRRKTLTITVEQNRFVVVMATEGTSQEKNRLVVEITQVVDLREDSPCTEM
ncbi:MAG: hypothetical protein WC091_01860 [Sulfuricellaceae bacterium]